jgi:hypothetical protein
MSPTIRAVPLFERLRPCKDVLVAGAGGGFDVLSALPLALALEADGKRVHLANLTFSYLGGSDAVAIAPGLHEIRATTEGDGRYFPEKHLAAWRRARGEDDRVYTFDKVGAASLREAYALLARKLGVDAVVLVDGGTDILMHGDEAGLGTPAEDVTSLLAASALDVPVKALACIGFGIDAHHGVCHADFLENVAALARDGAYLGAFSLVAEADEARAWQDAVRYVQAATPGRESIVCASLADAVAGAFGDHHSVERTRESGTELFINPLMSLVWGFDLDAVAARCRYADAIRGTRTIFEVHAAIEAYRRTITPRKRRALPF